MQSKAFSFSEFLSQSNLLPASVVGHILQLNQSYLQERDFLRNGITASPHWNIEHNEPKYRNYVLVIGESMRADYTSLYGYPLETTPFLDKVNGTIFKKYISAGPNTIPSLQRTLYRQVNDSTIYSDNIISLANQANLATYWLSNQGAVGQYDVMASRIGSQAKYTYFTKSGDYESKNVHDEMLLPEFKKALNDNKQGTKLIVLHLMGSHPHPCERIKKFEIREIFNLTVSCYVESIKETDRLLSDVERALKENGKSYSVIYFSDHGLSKDKNNRLYMIVNNIYKQNYTVPFIKFSSDDTSRIWVENPQTAFNFMNGFAQWLGIKENHLSEDDFFKPVKQNIKVFNWKENIEFESLAEDPPHLP